MYLGCGSSIGRRKDHGVPVVGNSKVKFGVAYY